MEKRMSRVAFDAIAAATIGVQKTAAGLGRTVVREAAFSRSPNIAGRRKM